MTSEGPRESLGDVVGRVIAGLQGLIRGEIDLAKAQAKEKVGALGKGGGLLAGAGFCALVVFFLLVTAAVAALALALPTWLAALVVAAVFGTIAAILAVVGIGSLKKSSAVTIDPKAGFTKTAQALKAGLATAPRPAAADVPADATTQSPAQSKPQSPPESPHA